MDSLIVPEKKSKSIYGVLDEIYFYFRTMGVFQFSANISETSDRQMYLTNADWFIFGVQFTFVSTFLIISMALERYVDTNKSSLLSLGTKILMRSGVLAICVNLVLNLINRSKIWSIFQRMDEFDLEIKSMGTTINYSQHKMYTRIFVKTQIFISLLFIAIAAYNCRNFTGIIIVSAFLLHYVVMNAGFSALLGLFTFLLLNVKLRFKKLNENLCLISPIIGKIKVVNTSQDDAISHIMRMSQLHDKLNDIIETINYCLSLQVMAFVAGAFVFSVVSLYSLYKTWSTTDLAASDLALLHTVWSVYCNAYIIAILWAGSTMRNEGQQTGVLLHNYINNCNDPDVTDRIVGATASYLTIMIQFDSTSLMNFDRNVTSDKNNSINN